MTSYRLPAGGLIDRARPLSFRFDGKPLGGFAGDTLASALLANGQMLVARSFKYHRPRGVLTAGSAEPNALVTVGTGGRTEANTRASVQELYEGLEAASQNRWPSLAFDVGAVNNLVSPFLSAGFYYKTFMWPAAFWEKVYEPLIRKAAGLGRASLEHDPDRYEKSWAHCDLLVIGGGAAGLTAALTAGRAGMRVILADEQPVPGGGLLDETAGIGGAAAPDHARALAAELDAMPNVRVMTRTTVFGWYDDNVFGAIERVQKHVREPDPARPVEILWRIAARRAILASGAQERPLVFGGNDTPGVQMAGAMRSYLNRHAVAPGSRVAIFTTNDAGYALARDLKAAGVGVAAIIDPRTKAGRPTLPGIETVDEAMVTDALGGKALKSVTVVRNGQVRQIEADALAMSGGFNPVINLACQRGAKPVWSNDLSTFLAPPDQPGLAIAGAAAGLSGLAAAFESGRRAALSVLAAAGLPETPADLPEVDGEFVPHAARPLWFVPGAKTKAFVDFQNDVHTGDLGLAVRENYGHVELAKRYTTTGMATDQGKLSNVNAIGILAGLRGVSPAEVGMTTHRPFFTPVSFGALAGPHHGQHFQPVRHSPLHGWAEKNGARFVETGLWYRSSWFVRDGETHWRESVDREVVNVRAHVGICDVSMLGKISVTGQDAAEFLDRVYCNPMAKLPVGKARYGLMLREDGFLYDDGTVSRLGENEFFVTTTTAYAAQALTHMEFCAQALWPELDVRLASVSDQWAQMAIAGPRARSVLEALVDDDLSNEAFPFLAARRVSLFGGRLHGMLFRISFSGELAYELAVPADHGEHVADAVLEAGREHGIQPYGIEALSVLRIEKGHVTHNEINGTVVPADLGFGRMVSAKKPDFIGKHMAAREGLNDPQRLQLAGVVPLDPALSFKTGSHILKAGDAATLENDQGYVSSSCFSPHLGKTIGLALVKGGASRHGEEVLVWNALAGEYTSARLTSPVFIDPEGGRLHA